MTWPKIGSSRLLAPRLFSSVVVSAFFLFFTDLSEGVLNALLRSFHRLVTMLMLMLIVIAMMMQIIMLMLMTMTIVMVTMTMIPMLMLMMIMLMTMTTMTMPMLVMMAQMIMMMMLTMMTMAVLLLTMMLIIMIMTILATFVSGSCDNAERLGRNSGTHDTMARFLLIYQGEDLVSTIVDNHECTINSMYGCLCIYFTREFKNDSWSLICKFKHECKYQCKKNFLRTKANKRIETMGGAAFGRPPWLLWFIGFGP